MKLALFLALAGWCGAQGTISPVNTTTPPAGGYAPGAVIPINIVKTGNPTATAVQFDVQSMVGVATVTWTIAPALAASKTITCGPPSTTTCVVVGLNQTPIPDGPIAVATVTLASSISLPAVTFGLWNSPVESDPSGSALAVTVVNPTISLSVAKSRCDVNGDGTIGQVDLALVIAQITARTTSAATDLNSDGVTNALDAQIVATAAAGGACNAK